jgi:hypothetical protein
MAIVGFLLAWITYPIAGILTGIAFALGGFVLQNYGVNGVGQIFTLCVPCYIVFRFAMLLERRAAKLKPYRIFRQCWRIFAGTGLVHAITRRLHSGAVGVPMDAYVIDAVLTGLAPFVFYLNSLRLDAKNNLATIRFKWFDLALAAVKSRFVRPVIPDIRETGVLQGREPKSGASMTAQVAGQWVTMGNAKVPIGDIRKTAYGRRNRVQLGVAGAVLLLIFSRSILGGSSGVGHGFVSQIFSVAGLALAALLLVWASLPNALAGKLGGPYRFLKVFYFGGKSADAGFAQMQFNDAEDEHRFVSAIANCLKAMPRNEPKTIVGEFQESQAPAT